MTFSLIANDFLDLNSLFDFSFDLNPISMILDSMKIILRSFFEYVYSLNSHPYQSFNWIKSKKLPTLTLNCLWIRLFLTIIINWSMEILSKYYKAY